MTLQRMALLGASLSRLWTPSDITTALWLDASDVSTVTTVSGAVSQWNDKSGNARHATQGTSGNRPAYTPAGQNGLNVATFDGVNSWMALPNTTNPPGVGAVFAACKPNHINAGCFIIGRAYNWGSWQLLSAGTGTTARYGVGRVSVDEGIATLSGLTNNTDKILTGVYNGTDVRVSSNGGTFASTAYTATPAYSPDDATSLGAARNTSNLTASVFRGGIYEVIVLHSAPSQDTIDRMQGYLAHKWGFAGSLPSGHPYKSAAPTT